ncbi:hypothetical protein [Paracidovorax valerianellae]|uniref:Uncharacterized protein n=1 Tax=Paracidovorax valerianellae TaxID=187868 RepID=A0A1G6MHK2_9BURK|nr:hypothetical protein [Paracidovorax valerianellae]MDA8444021.1 hypothetical protein [Paracidovorax valerianellae]SDC54754.1 hypothetical protein SAMN05192589_102411 [Paracidovorax valerianellae]
MRSNHPSLPALALLAALGCSPLLAQAQASCSSDGTAQPVALYERFINADCESCWAGPPAHVPGPSALVLDWIVPGGLADDAPLSAAATRDALQRLQDLGRGVPQFSDTHTAEVQPLPGRLRVASGLAMNDYLGTGISFKPAPRAPLPAGDYAYSLVLVESVPAGTAGTPVDRNVVRNVLQGIWNAGTSLSKKEQSSWMENRSMRTPEGANPERLFVAGWLQDAQGRIVAAAQSRCAAGS